MKFIAPFMACLALAAPAAAQDYRVEVFGGSSTTDALTFAPTLPPAVDLDVSSQGFYGLSIDRLNVFVPGLDIGLEYSSFGFEYTASAPDNINSQSLLVTATYNYEVAPNFEMFATAGLGVMHVEYNSNPAGDFYDNTFAGMAGLGGRYSFDAFSVFAEYRHHGVFNNAEFEYLGFPFGADIQGDIFLIGAGFSF